MHENPYTVQPDHAAPLQFHNLPPEVRSEVIKRTHARFEVTHRTEVAPVWLANNKSNPAATNRGWLVFWRWRLNFVPVVLRYEFNLQRRLANTVPQMTARFSRRLDPALKQTALWLSCPRIFQEGIERAAAQVVEIEPFSELKFDELGNYGFWGLFCFLRQHEPQSLAPQWSKFCISSQVLDEVRDKMQNVFCQPFSHV